MSQKNIMIKDMINSENSEKHDVTIILKLPKSYSAAARSSIKMLYNYCDVIFWFKI